MLAQTILISYHTEAFVKTEVGCTVVLRLTQGLAVQGKAIKITIFQKLVVKDFCYWSHFEPLAMHKLWQIVKHHAYFSA